MGNVERQGNEVERTLTFARSRDIFFLPSGLFGAHRDGKSKGKLLLMVFAESLSG